MQFTVYIRCLFAAIKKKNNDEKNLGIQYWPNMMDIQYLYTACILMSLQV